MNRTAHIDRALAAIAFVALMLPAFSGAAHADAPLPPLTVAQADLRQQKIEECERDNGVDCEREIDTELQAAGVEHPPMIVPGADLENASQALAQRRQQMIDDCEQNNGVDCATEVDTELEAEGSQEGSQVIHLAPQRRPAVRNP